MTGSKDTLSVSRDGSSALLTSSFACGGVEADRRFQLHVSLC
jgi:hypothetical protein